MICTTDTGGNTVWMSKTRQELEWYVPDLRKNGERWRIQSRYLRVNRAKVHFWVMTINPPPPKGR